MRTWFATIAELLIAAPALSSQPTITFDKNLITVTGVSAGARVAIYGVAHDFKNVLPELLRWAREVADDDRDGAVTLEIPRDVPSDSQWFAIDLSAGDLVAASPRGDDPREVPFDGPGVVDSHASLRGALRVKRAQADFFVARTGDAAGSWVMLAGDNAGGDADARPDGFISGELEKFRPVGHSPAAPAAFAQADIAIVVDPFSLEYSIYSGKGR